jgi:hypothetical protein
MAFDEDWDAEREVDYFDASLAQNHLLIIRAFDAPRYYRTENNPDGMVHPGRGKDFDPFPNTVVRCAVADLDADDGPRIYPESVLFPFSITKTAKNWVGKGPQLLMWRKTGPKQTDPYELRNMRGDDESVKVGTQFLNEHPEFMELKAPEPYDERPPSKDRDRDRRDDRDRYDDRDRDRYDDRRDSRRDDDWGRERRPSGGGRRDSGGARDWGQHDDRRFDDRGGRRESAPPRRDAYADDPWRQPSHDERRRGDGDGSFMSRSRNHRGEPQNDDEIPF